MVQGKRVAATSSDIVTPEQLNGVIKIYVVIYEVKLTTEKKIGFEDAFKWHPAEKKRSGCCVKNIVWNFYLVPIKTSCLITNKLTKMTKPKNDMLFLYTQESSKTQHQRHQ